MIKYVTSFAIGLMILSSCGIEIDIYDKAKNVRAKEFDAGRCTDLVTKEKKKRKSPSGFVYQTDFFRIQESTDSIEAKVGAQFGIEYMIISNEQQWVPIKTEWTFPSPIVNQHGKSFDKFSFKNSELSRERTYLTIKLSHPAMIVKGEWQLKLYHKRKVILEKSFYLY